MQPKLAAFKIFRRLAVLAIFTGQVLDFVEVHHLSNVPKVATETLDRFVGWATENFHIETAVLAADEDEHNPRIESLTMTAERKLLERGVPVWKVSESQLLESFGIPPLKQKSELRQVAQSLWPYVASQHLPALDAALIGLYVQVERLLSA